MKAAYFDCFSGISGDMTLGALVDAGCPLDCLRDALRSIQVPGWQISSEKVWKNGVSATHVRVNTEDTQTHRSLSTILAIIDKSSLDSGVKARASAIFTKLGEAEATVHDVPIEKIHFHEVGAVDAIVDIVGASVGFAALGIEWFFCSALNVGGGTAKMAHGVLPVPAPATARLLMGKPTYSNGLQKELVTPTGAAIVSTICQHFGPQPPMNVSAIGYGAGATDLESQPNVLRLMIGEVATRQVQGHGGTIRVLEANVDDMSPQIFGYLLDKALAAGALDVFSTPIQMKKSRPGMLLTILCTPEDETKFREMLFAETTTIGVRSHLVERYALAREFVQVTTRFGDVRVKVARADGRVQQVSPEFDDCRKLAEEKNVPLHEVMEQALLRYEEQHK
ncbi:MAG TPA: nickel pincer cofactor biosynthesis protein LarC [Dongiaceae bacterium]|nr:nickel pincer cofactor biosynthesis protein LarC [Dongiaceae bacterium]